MIMPKSYYLSTPQPKIIDSTQKKKLASTKVTHIFEDGRKGGSGGFS